MQRWELLDPKASYKGDTPAAQAARRRILEALQEKGLCCDSGDVADSCVASDDDLDALICAVLAKAIVDQRMHHPPGELIDVARREGWIHMPTGPIDETLSS